MLPKGNACCLSATTSGQPAGRQRNGLEIAVSCRAPCARKLDLRMLDLNIVRLSTWAELAPYEGQWDCLAQGVPFRSWAWCSTWWKHYGDHGLPGEGGPELYVLAAFNQADRLVGIAPWYRHWSGSLGSTLEWLGTGEVCSDYLGLLCEPAFVEPVTRAMAAWLTDAACGERYPLSADRWDLLSLPQCDAQDMATRRLAGELESRGCGLHCRPTSRCWRIALPLDWARYEATLSKSHRKQIRRADRNLLHSGRTALHCTSRLDDLPGALAILVDLHQRRRQALGQPGCFAAPRFAAFHRDVLAPMFRRGQCELHWLELDGTAIAAEYHLTGNGIVYAYQSGIAPEALRYEPGRLLSLAVLQRAIALGYRGFDLCRGDERYKAHWRAQPRESLDIRIAANRPAARLRLGLWVAGSNVKRWMKQTVGADQ